MRSLFVLLLLCLGSLSYAEDGYVEVLGPPGIKIYLDGKLQGETDELTKGYVIQDVAPGTHVVKAAKKGFEAQEKKFKVAPGQIVSWRLAKLRHEMPKVKPEPDVVAPDLVFGTLRIKSVPTSCSFSSKDLDFARYEKADAQIDLPEVPVGEHSFTFSAMGKDLTMKVEVRATETAVVMVNFPRGAVTVTYVATPPRKGRGLGKVVPSYPQRVNKTPLSREGGGPGTEASVTAALRWLRRAQSKGGKWDSDGWTHLAKHPDEGQNAGDGRYDVGVTSLALLAYLGNGQTHRGGKFRNTVKQALNWLRTRQKPNGSLGFDRGETIYNHAIATQALCEAYGMTRDFALRRVAERALKFCLDAQNPGMGWQYGIKRGRNDTSVTGWMVTALKAGKRAGLDVPDEAFLGARRWFVRATSREGEVGYSLPGGGSSFLSSNDGKFDPLPTMTGVAVLCRIFAGERRSADRIRLGGKVLSQSRPTWTKRKGLRKVNFYYWYYGTNSMFQLGGPNWLEWNKSMQKALLPTQCIGGVEDGSWPPVGEWCLAGGRVYATAINALTLETYYRYKRQQNQ